jgi:hypothetical protein
VAPNFLQQYGTLRKTIKIKARIDLELEIGDVVLVKHNTPLSVSKGLTDYTKFTKSLGYYRACKIEGIETDYTKRQNTYDLVDYSSTNTEPQMESEKFKYLHPVKFGLKE